MNVYLSDDIQNMLVAIAIVAIGAHRECDIAARAHLSGQMLALQAMAAATGVTWQAVVDDIQAAIGPIVRLLLDDSGGKR